MKMLNHFQVWLLKFSSLFQFRGKCRLSAPVNESEMIVTNVELSDKIVQDHTCFICNAESKLFDQSIIEIKSEHSQTSVCDLIMRFLGNVELHRNIEDELFQNGAHICSECISRINDYDLACITAERVGNELRELVLHTDSYYLNEVPNAGSGHELDPNEFGGSTDDITEEGSEIQNVAIVEIKVESNHFISEDSCGGDVANTDLDIDTISDLEGDLNEADADMIPGKSKNGAKIKRVYECDLCPKKFDLWKEMRVCQI